MKRQYIIIDPFTGRPYLFEHKAEAVHEAIQMHNDNKRHPSYALYYTDIQGRGLYIGRLVRDFGTDHVHFADEQGFIEGRTEQTYYETGKWPGETK